MSTHIPSIAERFCAVIEVVTHESRRFKELEELSGIASVSWRKAFTQGQRPTAEMIEIVSRTWPEFAFWLATGIDDPDYGHLAPSRLNFKTLSKPVTAAADFFRYRISVQNEVGTNESAVRASGHAIDISDLAALRWKQVQRQKHQEADTDGDQEN